MSFPENCTQGHSGHLANGLSLFLLGREMGFALSPSGGDRKSDWLGYKSRWNPLGRVSCLCHLFRLSWMWNIRCPWPSPWRTITKGSAFKFITGCFNSFPLCSSSCHLPSNSPWSLNTTLTQLICLAHSPNSSRQCFLPCLRLPADGCLSIYETCILSYLKKSKSLYLLLCRTCEVLSVYWYLGINMTVVPWVLFCIFHAPMRHFRLVWPLMSVKSES